MNKNQVKWALENRKCDEILTELMYKNQAKWALENVMRFLLSFKLTSTKKVLLRRTCEFFDWFKSWLVYFMLILGLKYLCNLFELRIHQWIASWPEKKNVLQCVILSSKDQVGYRYSFPRREGSIYVLIPGAPPLMCLGRGGTPVHCNSALCAVWNSNGLIDLLKGETIVKSGGLIGLIVV